MRHDSLRTGYTRGHHSLRENDYADGGGDRGLLWARSTRWVRNEKYCWTGCCFVTRTISRDGSAVGLGSNAPCAETLNRRQQGSGISERGRFGAELPPWQIEGSFATSCCSMKCTACKPATRACTTMKHVTSPARTCLPDHLRSAAIPERTAKPAMAQQGGCVSNRRRQNRHTGISASYGTQQSTVPDHRSGLGWSV